MLLGPGPKRSNRSIGVTTTAMCFRLISGSGVVRRWSNLSERQRKIVPLDTATAVGLIPTKAILTEPLPTAARRSGSIPNWPTRISTVARRTVKGDFDRAIADYNRATELNPKSSIGYNNLCDPYLDKGDNDRA